MKQLILLRHGETPHNTARIFQADSAPLSEQGQAQVQQAVEQLKNYPINLILSSPLKRARETAQVAQAALRCPLRENNILLEFKNPPAIRGKSYDDPEADRLYRAWLKTLQNPQSLKQENTENYFDLYTRAGYTLQAIARLQEDYVLAVTHSEIMRAIIAHVLLDGDKNMQNIISVLEHIKIENAHFVMLALKDSEKWRVTF